MHSQDLSNQEEATSEADRFLSFSLNGGRYGIPLPKVKEVIEVTEITPVPFAPRYFKGIMNLRGQVISIIDLRLKFEMSKAEIGSQSAVIILDLSPLCLGVIVDSVNSVLAVERSEIKPPPHMETKIKNDPITGVIRLNDDFVLLLDVERALDVEDSKISKMQADKQAA